jgi:plastocyanin
MKNIQFVPKSVTVKPGQTIKWENLDTVDHDVKADSGADFASDTFGKGGTYEYTADQAGKIEYECTLHPGMVGTIEVR